MIKVNRADIGILWLRLLMGAGIAYHGFGKVFGEIMPQFIQGVEKMGFPFPVAFAWAAALSEFLGGICIFVGVRTRLAAFFVFCTMSVAAFVVHGADPFKVKELALAYWTMAGALICTGGGKISIDGALND